MIVLGIDPGMKGALAQYDGLHLTLYPIPTAKSTGRGREVLWTELTSSWDTLFPFVSHAFLERVHSRPGEGVSSAFKFGRVFGGLEAAIATRRIPMTLVTPSVWMKAMGVGRGSKEASVIRAAQLFPDNAPQFRGPRGGILDGLAEAALIALYGHRKLTGDGV